MAHVHDQEKLQVQIQEINDLEFKLERERHRTTKLTGQLTDAFPEGIEFCDPDEEGFRGLIVEFYNIVSGRWVRCTGFSVVTAILLTQTRALS